MRHLVGPRLVQQLHLFLRLNGYRFWVPVVWNVVLTSCRSVGLVRFIFRPIRRATLRMLITEFGALAFSRRFVGIMVG